MQETRRNAKLASDYLLSSDDMLKSMMMRLKRDL